MALREKTSAPKKAALGKGINSLLGDVDFGSNQSNSNDNEVKEANQENMIVQVPIQRIEANPHQPRKIFEDSSLKDLAASLKENGVLQPILVTRAESASHFVLIAGERRLRAAKLAGFDTIPAIIKEGTSNEMLRLALIENIQREDLNIIEEAEAYNSLIKDFGLTQEQCATTVGKDRSTVTNAIRLLGLPYEIRDDLMDGRLSMGHGRALLSLDDEKVMLRARDMIMKKELSVRETEQLCKSFKKKPASGEDKKADGQTSYPDLDYIAETLRSQLRTKVKVVGNPSRGKIEISYFSSSELERILALLGHKFS